jgi:hypothetical protein
LLGTLRYVHSVVLKKIIAQKVCTACSRTSYRVVPLNNLNKYLHNDTSEIEVNINIGVNISVITTVKISLKKHYVLLCLLFAACNGEKDYVCTSVCTSVCL